MIRLIDGKRYSITRNEYGYGVTSLESRTDRLHRAYQVYADSKGRPVRCSCPDCLYRAAWCKHLQEVEALWREEHPEEQGALLEEVAKARFPAPTSDSLHPEGF